MMEVSEQIKREQVGAKQEAKLVKNSECKLGNIRVGNSRSSFISIRLSVFSYFIPNLY